MMQHDEHNAEDLDTDGEDHAVDELPLRLHVAALPATASSRSHDRNPLLVANAFKIERIGLKRQFGCMKPPC